MLKFKNPYFTPAPTSSEYKAKACFAPVTAWLQTQTANKIITVAELKAALPAIAADIDRQVFNLIMQGLALEVINPEDTTAP